MRQEELLRKLLLLDKLKKMFPYTLRGLMDFAQIVLTEFIPGSPLLNRVQADILGYLIFGPKFRMIQAQRGQSKTTLTAIFCVFTLIHKPWFRIVVFAQKDDLAKEIAGWIVKIFRRLNFLEFMLPDTQAGDKASVSAFDLHYSLKGGDKSPSVTCRSIDASVSGIRADLLIADDVESLKNARTETGREILKNAVLEFESINQYGDIVWLGTPQSIESIYNGLPSRGYDIRIWPGRYPTNDQMDFYGTFLAPLLAADIKKDPSIQEGGGVLGNMGKPTCPEMYNEELLCTKEIKQGLAKFLLQFMLNTSLADTGRFPLKLNDLIVQSFSQSEGPIMPIWNNAPLNRVTELPTIGHKASDKFYRPIPKDYVWKGFDRTVMYIDPSGGGKNGDEIAYAIIKLLGTFIYIYDVGGVPGGYQESNLLQLVHAAKNANVKEVFIEKNYGHGAHYAVLNPLFQREYPISAFEEVYESGQKELRIIDVVEPFLSSHRLVVDPQAVQRDLDSIAKYPAEIRMTYSLFHQMSSITRDKDCLKHDDRLDALAGAIRQITESIDYDMQSVLLRQQAAELKKELAIWNDPILLRVHLTGVEEAKPNRANNHFTCKTSYTHNRFQRKNKWR